MFTSDEMPMKFSLTAQTACAATIRRARTRTDLPYLFFPVGRMAGSKRSPSFGLESDAFLNTRL